MRSLGILGGGQLGRMLALAARQMGVDVTVVDPNEDAPARAVSHHIPLPYDDWDALDELALSDVVTFEFENIPDEAARRLQAARPVFPPPEALLASQDRLVEKNLFRSLGIETPKFLALESIEQARAAYEELGPCIFKTRRLGYDGKGQFVVRSFEQAAPAFEELGGGDLIAEQLVSFDRELSVLLCRDVHGRIVTYPVTENTHKGGVLHKSVAPAPSLSEQLAGKAREYAKDLAQHLNYVGVLALELFQVGDELLANEFAPRVHNSGHWTIEGAKTSQFENHVRAVLGLPLGRTDALQPTGMLNLIGQMPNAALVLDVDDAHLHDYEKEPRSGRKVGHITVRASSHEELAAKLELLEQILTR